MSLFLNTDVLSRVVIESALNDSEAMQSEHRDFNSSTTWLAITSAASGYGGGGDSSTPSYAERPSEVIRVVSFIFLGVLGSALAVLGFLGNTLSIVVLQHRQMRSSTSYYLLSLAIYDNCILLAMMVYFCLPAMSHYSPSLKDYDSFSSQTIMGGYPLSLTAQMGSIYTCVGFTVERFIAVCRPLHVANTCTRSRTLRAIVLIFLWSFLYNIPRFFHYQTFDYSEDWTHASSPSDTSLASEFNPNLQESSKLLVISGTFNAFNASNMTSAINIMNSSSAFSTSNRSDVYSKKKYSHRETEFGSDIVFKHVYLIYSQLFFMFLFPFVIILVMNVCLIRAVKSSKSMQQTMCASARKEHNLTVMLIAVIVVFLVCQFPTIIDNILVAVFGDGQLKTNDAYYCFYILCTFMVEINAASNFLLYCFFGKKFRLMLLNILRLKRKKRHIAYRSTVTNSRTSATRVYEMEVSVM